MTGQPLGIGALLSDTLRLTGTAFGRLFAIAFVPALVSAVLAGAADPVPSTGVTAGQLWSGLVDLVLGTFVAGVLCLIALDAAFGKRHEIGDYLRQAARHFLPLLVFGLLLSLAMAIGLVFLVLPGLYVAGRYLPYVPATVFEDRGWEGTSRAEELTRGYRWPLVGALVVFGAMVLAFVLVIGLFVGMGTGTLGRVPTMLVGAAVTAACYAVFATFTAVVYLRLRALREGLSPSDIAATVG
jgi:hypothetical protein